MRTEVIYLPEDVVQEYRELVAEQTVYDRMPHKFSHEQHVNLELKMMDMEAHIVREYGDEEHNEQCAHIDYTMGTLYICD